MRDKRVRKMEREYKKRKDILQGLKTECMFEDIRLDLIKRHIGFLKAKDCPAKRTRGLCWCILSQGAWSCSYNSLKELYSEKCFKCVRSEGEINVKMLGLKLEKK